MWGNAFEVSGLHSLIVSDDITALGWRGAREEADAKSKSHTLTDDEEAFIAKGGSVKAWE